MRPTEWTTMMISVQTEFLTHAQNISMTPGLNGQGGMENRAEKVPSTEQQTKPGRMGRKWYSCHNPATHQASASSVVP